MINGEERGDKIEKNKIQPINSTVITITSFIDQKFNGVPIIKSNLISMDRIGP